MSKYRADGYKVIFDTCIGQCNFMCADFSAARCVARDLNELHDENQKMRAVVDAVECISVNWNREKSGLSGRGLKLLDALAALKHKTPEQLQQERNDAADKLFDAGLMRGQDKYTEALEGYQNAKKAHEASSHD